MLLGRLTDEHGNGDTLIAADEHDKAYYKALTDQGRVRCPDCDAKLIHRSNANDENSHGLKCEPIITDGNTAKVRVPHWQSIAIEDHAAGCDYRDDPTISEHVKTFRQALKEGKPILIRINFDVGFEGLRNRFNASASPGSGLWDKLRWEREFPDHVAVSARDITDVLHYMSIAKHALPDKAGLKQLYFKTTDAVQAAQRFVVSDKPKRIGQVISAIFERAVSSRTAQQHFQETPRLFVFTVSKRQQELASRDVVMSRIFGQKYEGLPYATLRDGRGRMVTHDIKMGMQLKEPNLTNASVVDRGNVLWVVGTPTLLWHEIKRMKQKAQGIDIDKSEKPAFLMLNVEKRRAFGVVGIEDMKPREARRLMQPAQPTLFPDGEDPAGGAGQKKAKHKGKALANHIT